MKKEEILALIRLSRKTPDELMTIYKAWDYHYKPKYSCFLHTAITLVTEQSDFVRYMLRIRAQAYYSGNHTDADYGFNVLACLIYIAIIEKIETPFDHVIKSDKDFEWKLNNLFEEK